MKKILILGLAISLFAFVVGCSNDDVSSKEEKEVTQKEKEDVKVEDVVVEDVVAEDTELEPKTEEGPVSEEDMKLMGDKVTAVLSQELLEVSESGDLNKASKENIEFFEKATENKRYDITKFNNWTLYSETIEARENKDKTYNIEVEINLSYVGDDPTTPLSETKEKREYKAEKNGSDFEVIFVKVLE